MLHGDDPGENTGWQVGEFFRLYLVKSAAVDTPFLDEMLAAERLKMEEHDRVEVGPGSQGGFHLPSGRG